MSPPEPRWCASCGRTIEWRRRWERDWDQVRYCSSSCRRRGVRPVDRALEQAVRELLGQRVGSATICPAEAARLVAARVAGATDGGGDAWRALMEPARRAARRLVVTGEVEMTQGGRVVDPSSARGPVRVRRGPGWKGEQPSAQAVMGCFDPRACPILPAGSQHRIAHC